MRTTAVRMHIYSRRVLKVLPACCQHFRISSPYQLRIIRRFFIILVLKIRQLMPLSLLSAIGLELKQYFFKERYWCWHHKSSFPKPLTPPFHVHENKILWISTPITSPLSCYRSSYRFYCCRFDSNLSGIPVHKEVFSWRAMLEGLYWEGGSVKTWIVHHISGKHPEFQELWSNANECWLLESVLYIRLHAGIFALIYS